MYNMGRWEYSGYYVHEESMYNNQRINETGQPNETDNSGGCLYSTSTAWRGISDTDVQADCGR
jgi:hypothetical protein